MYNEELWDATYEERSQRLSAKREWRERLAEAEETISRLQKRIAALEHVICFGGDLDEAQEALQQEEPR